MIIDKRFLSNQGDTLNLNIIKWSIDVKSLLAFREDLNREDDLTQEELEQGCLKVVLFLKDLEENSLIDKYFELAKADLGEEVILNFYKNIKKDEINKARDKAIAEILYNEKVFSNNFNDRALISTFLASDKENLNLIAKDNSTLLLSKENAKELNDLMFESLNENTLKARRLKDEIQNAKSIEDLLKIEW